MTGWRTVALKEARGLLGSRGPKLGMALVALVLIFGGYVTPTNVPDPTIVAYDSLLRGVLVFLLPLFGLLLGYRTVVAERAGGQLALTLSFPYARSDVVLGKAVGRGLVVAGTILVGVLGGAALVEYPFGSVAAETLAAYLAVTTLYGLAFLAIGIGLSTVTVSMRRATVLMFGVFFLAVVAWAQLDGYLLLALQYVELADETLPDWALFLYRAEPTLLYQRTLDTFVADSPAADGTPWFLRGGFAAVLLCCWVCGPILVGYLRFRGTDL